MKKHRLHYNLWIKIFLFVGDNEGLYNREITELTRATSTTVHHVVRSLTLMGYLCWKHETTKRIKNYYLTEKGRLAHEVLKQIEVDSFIIMEGGL